jgi:hypothetical protein
MTGSAANIAPTDPATFTFLTMTTKPNFRAVYAKAAGGNRRLHGPLDQHAGREGAVVGGHDGDGGGVILRCAGKTGTDGSRLRPNGAPGCSHG